jgi:hypothetical protein
MGVNPFSFWGAAMESPAYGYNGRDC